ncbi:MAG: arginine repressor [Clostridia bacterium]|nr:arginine repressor [Clostridia bacterium]
MKRNRHEKLLELITQYEINTQDELIERLREHGFDVTQATVSRDIRELKILKMTTGKGSYRYVLPKQPETTVKFSSALIDSIISVEHACNNIVLKTYPGMAQAVAVGIDRMDLHQILGSVAGDDTIIIIVRDAEAATEIANRIHDLLKTV